MIDRVHIPPILPTDLVGGCRIVAMSDVGRVREENQDFMGHAVRGAEQLLVVADGMGGHSGGFEASRIAVDALLKYFQDSEEGTSPAEVLRTGIEQANARVRLAASENPMLRGMGSTITAALISNGHAHLAHVGDSRIYLIRDGQNRLLTLDHSRIIRMIEVGMITPEQAKNHPMGHILERSIGSSDSIDVELRSSVKLAQGDVLLLCSDGLWGLVEDQELAELFKELDLKTAAERAIGVAMQRGADDNTTLGVLRMEEGPEAAEDISDVRVALYAKGAQEIAQREEAAMERAKSRQAMASQIPAISHTPPVDDAPLTGEDQAHSTDGRAWLVVAFLAILAVLGGVVLFQDDDEPDSDLSKQTTDSPSSEMSDGADADAKESPSEPESDDGETVSVVEDLPPQDTIEPTMPAPEDVAADVAAPSPDAVSFELDAPGIDMVEAKSDSDDEMNDRALGFDEAQEMGMGSGGADETTVGGTEDVRPSGFGTRGGKPKRPVPLGKGPKSPKSRKELSNFQKNQERLKIKEARVLDMNDLYQSNAPPTLEQIEAQNAMAFPEQEEMMSELDELQASETPAEEDAELEDDEPSEEPETGESTDEDAVNSD